MHTQEQELSLDWLYRQEQLKLGQILPVNHNFTTIQISELRDPSDFLRPDSVVLSVGIGFAEDPEQLGGWSERLAAAGVVAIGFGSGLTFPTVPEPLIAAARELGLGLFEVPREIPFISITSAIAKEQARRASYRQQELLEQQEKLNSAAITGGIRQLCQQTAEFLSGAVAILDSDGRIAADVLGGELDAVVQARGRLDGASQALRTDDAFGLLHRMTRFGDRHHVLSVLMPARPTGTQRSLIRHCAGLADILLQRPHAQRNRESELNSLAMSLLLGQANHVSTAAEIFADIADAQGQIRPVIIAAADVQQVNRALDRAAESLREDDRALCHLRLSELPEPAALLFFRGTRSLRDVHELFGSTIAQLRMCIGLPTRIEQLTPELVQELAATALSVELGACAQPRQATQVWLRDPAVRGALDTRSRQTYDRLLAVDREQGSELAPTLVTYAQQGGQVGATAIELGIHRHTVRTRLERIAEICELDLRDPLTIAELLLVVATRGRV